VSQEYLDNVVLSELLFQGAAKEKLISNEQAKRVMRVIGSQPDMLFAPSVLGAQAVTENPRKNFNPWYEQLQNQIIKRQKSANYAPYVVQGHHRVPIEAAYSIAQRMSVEQGMEFLQRVNDQVGFGNDYGDFSALSAMGHQDSPGLNAHMNLIHGSKDLKYFGSQANEMFGLNPEKASQRFVDQIALPSQRLTHLVENSRQEMVFKNRLAEMLGISVDELVDTNISLGRGEITNANRNRDRLQKEGMTRPIASYIMNDSYSDVAPVDRTKRTSSPDNTLGFIRPGAAGSLKRLGIPGRQAGDLLKGLLNAGRDLNQSGNVVNAGGNILGNISF